MPLCPQITNTPITVTQTADFTVTSVIPLISTTKDGLATDFDNLVVQIDGKTEAYYQATAPSGPNINEGDIWFDTDDGNKQYYYNGTAWVSVQDTAIAAAQSAANAAAAAATAAQATADGKNKIYRQTTQPSTGPFAEGDLWFDTDDDNKIYRYTSGSWSTAVPLGNNALGNLSANKITSGTIDASVITVSNINAGNISTGTLNADRIASASITGTKIAAGTITASNIATGTITADRIATATITATQIAAGTITVDKLSAGTLTGFTVQTSSGNDAIILNGANNALQFKSNGSVVANAVPLSVGGSTFGLLLHYGSTPNPSGGTYPQIYIDSFGCNLSASGGSGGIGLTVTTLSGTNVTGSFTANNQVYMPNINTTTNAANMRRGTAGGGQVFEVVSSSQRFKENVTNLTSISELDPKKLLNLPVRAFTYKDNYLSANDDRAGVLIPGFIAEEVDANYPVAADYDSDGPINWNERMMIPGLLALIQDLYHEIDLLKGVAGE